MSKIDISDKGIVLSAKLKSEYETALSKITGDANIKFDLVHPGQGLSFISALTHTNKIGGKEFNSTSVAFKPPNQYVCSMSPREIESETPDGQYTMKGRIGFKITVTIKEKANSSQSLQPVSIPVGLRAGLLLVLVGAAIAAPESLGLTWGEILALLGFGAKVIVR